PPGAFFQPGSKTVETARPREFPRWRFSRSHPEFRRCFLSAGASRDSSGPAASARAPRLWAVSDFAAEWCRRSRACGRQARAKIERKLRAERKIARGEIYVVVHGRLAVRRQRANHGPAVLNHDAAHRKIRECLRGF